MSQIVNSKSPEHAHLQSCELICNMKRLAISRELQSVQLEIFHRIWFVGNMLNSIRDLTQVMSSNVRGNHFSNDYFLPTCIFCNSIWFAVFEFAWSVGLKLAWSKCPSVCIRSILDQSLQRCRLWWFIVDNVLFMNMALCIQFSQCLQKWRQKADIDGKHQKRHVSHWLLRCAGRCAW